MRFRLKTEFLTYARDQIRGGLWYKPTWWEAVQKVPPAAVLPRIKKRSIPRIRFIEDRLMGEFAARNPALRKLDARAVSHGGTSTVAAQFVAQQLRQLRANKSEEQAYDVATAWLIENGTSVLRRVNPSLVQEAVVTADQLPPPDLFETAMTEQRSLLSEALKIEEQKRKQRGYGAELPPYRTFMSAEEISGISSRTIHASEPRSPASAGAAAPESAPAAAGAPVSRSSGTVPLGSTPRSGSILDSADANDAVLKQLLSGSSAASGPPGQHSNRPRSGPAKGGPANPKLL